MTDAAREQRLVDEVRLTIAERVNDTVIHRLFSIGLDLHTTRASVPEAVQIRLDGSIGELDLAIHELRVLIFDLERCGTWGVEHQRRRSPVPPVAGAR